MANQNKKTPSAHARLPAPPRQANGAGPRGGAPKGPSASCDPELRFAQTGPACLAKTELASLKIYEIRVLAGEELTISFLSGLGLIAVFGSEPSEVRVDGGAPAAIAAGQPVLVSAARSATIAFEAGRATIVAVPAARVRQLGLDLAPASFVSGAASPACELLIEHARLLAGRTLPPGLAQVCGAHLLNLISLSLSPAPLDRPAPEGPAKDTLFQTILSMVAAHCSRPGFGAAEVAQALDINVRTLQKQLQHNGTTFKSELTQARLQMAHHALRDPAHGGRTIAEIALNSGFNDIATFNRAFRRHFGLSPSAVRVGGGRSERGAGI